MDFSDIIKSVTVFFTDYTVIAIAVSIVLLFMIYKKPKFFLGVFFIILLLAGVIYLLLNMSAGGVAKKKELIRKGVIPENAISLPLKSAF